MLSRIASRLQNLWAKFQSKIYRDAFVASHLKTNVAAQIVTMREDRGWTQHKLAEVSGMSQPRISLLEDPNYEKMTLSTLKRVASAFDVALVVRFAPFSELLLWANSASSQNLGVPSFKDDNLPQASLITNSNYLQIQHGVPSTNILTSQKMRPHEIEWGQPTEACSAIISLNIAATSFQVVR